MYVLKYFGNRIQYTFKLSLSILGNPVHLEGAENMQYVSTCMFMASIV